VWHIVYEFDLVPDIYGLDWIHKLTDWIGSAKMDHVQLWNNYERFLSMTKSRLFPYSINTQFMGRIKIIILTCLCRHSVGLFASKSFA